jgi:hypothetical protein
VTGRIRRRRVVAAMLGAFLPAAGIAVTAAVSGGSLPDTVPIHWSGLGEPDAFASTWTLLRWTLGTAVMAGAVASGAVAVIRRRTSAAGLVALAAGLGGVACAVWLTSVATTLPASDPYTARLGWHVLWIPAAIAWAAMFSWLVGRIDNHDVPTSAAPDRSSGSRTAWVTVLRSELFVSVCLIAAGVIAVIALTTEPTIWPLVCVPLAAMLLFSNVRVIVDRRGLRLLAGPFSTPLKSVPLADIVTAEAVHIDPLKWGGWGYRVIPGRSALVLRTGPGLVLRLRDGRRFAVTVDDPDTPAIVLTNLRRSIH